MIRCGIVKLGSTLKEIADVKGKVQWRRSQIESVETLRSMLQPGQFSKG
jgi:hypothetical protein